MATRILIRLLREAQLQPSKQAKDKNQYQEGFSLVVVILIALVLLLASIAALQRSGNNLLGSVFNTESKEARETAEAGITEIIGTLNQRNNRGLLVSGVSPSTWDVTNNPILQNPCNDKVDPSATAAAIGSAGTKPAGGEVDQRYFLKSISFTSIDPATGARRTRTFSRSDSSTASFSGSDSPSSPVFNPDEISLNGDKKGYLTVVVVGQVLRPGTTTVISSAEVKREFQIVPKCCDRSFGYTYANPAAPSQDHGVDLRPCPVTSAFTPLVVGTNGDGILDTKGKSYTLTSGGSPLKTIATLNSSEDCSPVADCQFNWGASPVNTTLLKPSNLELPSLPPTPTTVNKSACINSAVTLPYSGLATGSTYSKTAFPLTGNCTSSTVTVSQTVYQFQSKATATTTGTGKSKVTTYTCTPATLILGSNLPSDAITVDSSLNDVTLSTTGCYSQTSRNIASSTPDPYCAFNNATSRFDCLVRYMDGNMSVKVDSSEFPVNVYLYDAAGTSPAGGSVSFTGSGGISHVKCVSFSGSCSTDASLADANRFSMYGNVLNQSIDLKGNTGALAGFFYFPYANVSLSGGGGTLNFSGILWANNLSLNGNIDFALPSPGDIASNLCALYSNLCDSDPANDGIRPQYDYVARSVSTTSLFN